MQDFRNLKVWEKAHALTLDIYKASKSFPREEMYGMTSQMRRASVSIGANIAEGACRRGDVDFARFLQIAVGSASEFGVSLASGSRPGVDESLRLSATFRRGRGGKT